MVEDADFKILDLKPEHIFSFSDGIPGFEKAKRFALLTHKEEKPFARLTAVDFDLCFFVVNPFVINPEYKPDIDDEEIKKIGSPGNEEILILAIVAIPEDPRESTMNLAAPIIINTKEGLGRQVIISNYSEFGAKFKIWQE